MIILQHLGWEAFKSGSIKVQGPYAQVSTRLSQALPALFGTNHLLIPPFLLLAALAYLQLCPLFVSTFLSLHVLQSFTGHGLNHASEDKASPGKFIGMKKVETLWVPVRLFM